MRPKKGHEWMPFEQVMKRIKNLGIKNQKEFCRYVKKNPLCNIPSEPYEVYKNKGWTNWYDFLGKKKEVDTRNRNRNRKYTVNHDFFKVWSHDMAYILGLWWADGCIMSGTQFDITLHKNDQYLLEQISSKMKSNYPLYHNRNCRRFTITSQEIYNDIKKLGGMERKSLKICFPDILKVVVFADSPDIFSVAGEQTLSHPPCIILL